MGNSQEILGLAGDIGGTHARLALIMGESAAGRNGVDGEAGGAGRAGDDGLAVAAGRLY